MGWEVGGRFKSKGTYVYLWLIHVDVWQKPTQYCKAITLQLKINKIYILKSKSMEKEMATHSSIRAWKNPWTEESAGLKSMGLYD